MPRPLDPVSLQTFIAVCEEGSIARAAVRESQVPSALSKRVLALEAEVGVPLLERRSQGVRPTPAGEALLARAREVLAQLERVRAELGEFGTGAQGSVRVLASPSVLAEQLPEDIAAFLRRHPALRVSLDERQGAELLRGLREGAADLGVLWDQGDTAGLHVCPYRSDHLCVVMAAGHPLARRPALSFAETLDQPAICIAPGGLLDQMLRRQAALLGRMPSYRMQVSSLDAASRLVAAGLGLAIVPREVPVALAGAGRLALVPLAEAWARRRCARPARGCWRSSWRRWRTDARARLLLLAAPFVAPQGDPVSFLIVLAALVLLMFVAYRGYSVILFAPVAALLAVLLTDPSWVPPMFTGVFMDKLVGFVKLYFPVFLLGAVFGKVIELSGFSKSIVAAVIDLIGRGRAMLSIVVVCAVLTYGGVSLFVVVFAVYPFAAEMFRQSNIPKRLIPGTIALGAFTFTMDSLPGTPQIQNIIPTTFFKTTTWAAPWMGVFGAIFILTVGMLYLESRRRRAQAAGEGYGTNLLNEPEPYEAEKLPHPLLALLPLVLVGVLNRVFTDLIYRYYGQTHELALPGAKPVVTEVSKIAAVWAVEGALLVGILTVLVFAFDRVRRKFADGSKAAIAGALLASMNTASEYGFGGVIAALPGFTVIADALRGIPNPLINEAITVSALAGITGSASGGMSIALAAMADTFIASANAAGIPLEVLHRVASMASGGMDTLPHNGAVITLLAVTGLTHRQSYGDIFAITLIKTAAVFVVIGIYYLTGIY